MIEVSQIEVGNRMPVVSLAMPGTRAATVLVAFDAGARSEHEQENGVAHFLEHLVFKGGESHPTYRDVNEAAERLGAQLNAYTSHDVVAFHVTCRAESVMEAADLLTDFVARPRLDADELERERGVVIQEIARSDDQPASVADKLLDRAAFGEHPLGRSVLGPAEHLRSFSREGVLAFRERRWAPQRGGAFLAGDLSSVDPARLESLFGRFTTPPDPPGLEPSPAAEPRVLVERRDTNQSHLRLHWRSPVDPASTEERAAFAVYATLLGGSMGSRLFDEIREQRGLCYAIRAAGLVRADGAVLEVASGLDSTKCLEAHERIVEIVAELAEEGPRQEELERARAYAAGSTVLALESTGAVARRAAGRKILFGEVSSPEETIAALDAVTLEQVSAVARGIEGTPALACVGPHDVADFS